MVDDPWLMLGIILNQSSTLFTEAGILNQTWSYQMCLASYTFMHARSPLSQLSYIPSRNPFKTVLTPRELKKCLLVLKVSRGENIWLAYHGDFLLTLENHVSLILHVKKKLKIIHIRTVERW